MKKLAVQFYYPRALSGNGGVTTSLWSWAENLLIRGVEVQILADLGSSRNATGPGDVPVEHVAHRGQGRLYHPIEFDSRLCKDTVLVLSSAWVLHNHVAAMAARASGIPYIVTPHGGYNPNLQTNRILKQLAKGREGSLLSRALLVHTFFPSERDHVSRISPQANVIAVPTGSPHSDIEWTGDGNYILWFGRYDIRHKGLDLFLKSVFAIPKSDRPEIRMYGRDSKNTSLEVQAMVDRMGLSSNVQVNGPISPSGKATALAEAAAYVHPSRWECHSVTLTEALASGTPTVVSSRTSIASDLIQASAAIVADPETSDFSLAIRHVLSSETATRLSENGRRFMSSSLDWDVSIDRFLTELTNAIRHA